MAILRPSLALTANSATLAALLFHSLAAQNSNSSIPTNLAGLSSTLANHSAYNTTAASSNPSNSSSAPVWASSEGTNPGTNARIPQSISPTCQSYLALLNASPQIAACTAPLLNATASFAAGPAAVQAAQVKAAFDGLCGPHAGEGCAPRMMHDVLSHFAGNCSAELYAAVPAVRMTYDVLYILTPYRVALCAQEPSTGGYCASAIAAGVVNGTSTPKKESKTKDGKTISGSDFGALVTSVFGDKLVTQFGGQPAPPTLHTRALHNLTGPPGGQRAALNESGAANGAMHPNSDIYTATNLAFLFLSPDLPDSVLCRPCTQSVLAAYIGFEQATPHIGGLGTSGYLSGQLKLWQAVHSRCGQAFSEAIDQEAGIMSVLTANGAKALRAVGNWDTVSLCIVAAITILGFRTFGL